MSWESPFKSPEDAAKHLVDLVAASAEKAGSPLTHLDREILAREVSREEPISENLRLRASQLISEIIENEKFDDAYWDPIGVGSSLQWADDSHYSNIVAIAEEVISCINRGKLHGWKLAKDRILVITCGLLVVLGMFVIVSGLGFLFGWK